MTKIAAYLCAAFLGLLGVLGLPSTAQAATGEVPHIVVHLSRTTVTSGSPVTVTAHANTLCDWIVEFNGERRHTVDRSVRTTFTAPEVNVRTRLHVVVTCVVHTPPGKHSEISATTGSGSGRDVQTLVVRIPASATVDPPLTVLPGGTSVEPPHTGGTGLPNTGGPRRWLLALGLGSVLVGATLVRVGQRQRPAAIAADIPLVAS